MIFRCFSDVCLSDVCPFWRLSFLTFVASDVCPFWRLSFWRLSFLTFVVLTFVGVPIPSLYSAWLNPSLTTLSLPQLYSLTTVSLTSLNPFLDNTQFDTAFFLWQQSFWLNAFLDNPEVWHIIFLDSHQLDWVLSSKTLSFDTTFSFTAPCKSHRFP